MYAVGLDAEIPHVAGRGRDWSARNQESGAEYRPAVDRVAQSQHHVVAAATVAYCGNASHQRAESGISGAQEQSWYVVLLAYKALVIPHAVTSREMNVAIDQSRQQGHPWQVDHFHVG